MFDDETINESIDVFFCLWAYSSKMVNKGFDTFYACWRRYASMDWLK